MLLQPYNYGFSVPVVVPSKAQRAVKGMAIAGEARLAVDAPKLTDLAIIRLEEH